MSNTQSSITNIAVTVLAVLAAISLAACGGAPPSITGPEVVAIATADDGPMVVLSQTFDDVEMGEQRLTDISLARTGTLVLTVRWNDQNNYVSAVLSSTGCSRISSYGPVCQARHSIEHQGSEGREGRIEYPGASGAYRLLVENEGPSRESISVTAVLTQP